MSEPWPEAKIRRKRNLLRFSEGLPFCLPYEPIRPPIALRTDLSHITTELWEIPYLQMAHLFYI